MKPIKTKFEIILLLITQIAFCQNIFKAIVKDEITGNVLIGVNVFIKSTNIGGTTDTTGFVEISDIPDGTFTIIFSYIGYRSYEFHASFPLTDSNDIKTILLTPTTLELEGITVTTTRTNNRIEDTPVRVEVLGREEVDEEIAIKPGNISKLLGETSGIQIQQTSAISGNVSFRIQGLPGKYTQLLKDGFPIYSGFSSGLSLLQIPPLDLEQIEVIKGSSSSLYGGDAIAGIVNLISKTPTKIPEWFVLLNQTHKGGKDISVYYSKRNDKIGITLLASHSRQKAFDVNDDDFTDLPQFQQFTLSPKLFYYVDNTTSLIVNVTSSFDNRMGGDIIAIEKTSDSLHTFIEKNRSRRFTSQIKFEKKFHTGDVLTFKNSVNHFKRDFSTSSISFTGTQLSSYSEFSFLFKRDLHNTILGMNFINDTFKKENTRDDPDMDNRSFTLGVFAQDNWNFHEKFTFQTGFRIDYNNQYGFFILPRLSMLYKFSNKLHIRTGGGLGYRTPTISTDEIAAEQFHELSPIAETVKSEYSYGETIDINYNTIIFNEISFTLNQAFYYTKVYHSLIFESGALANGVLVYENANKPLISRGYDTNIHVTYDELALFVDYSYTHAQKDWDPYQSDFELTPKQKLNITVTFEQEDSWRTGIEAFYTGKQYLSNYTQTRDYWTMGLMVEKIFSHFSIIGNIENIFDTRQTKFEDVVIPPYNDPTFRQVWAPLDGIVANIALKIKL